MRNIMLELLGILILCRSKRNASSRVEPWNPQLLINNLATVLNVVAYLIDGWHSGPQINSKMYCWRCKEIHTIIFCLSTCSTLSVWTSSSSSLGGGRFFPLYPMHQPKFVIDTS